METVFIERGCADAVAPLASTGDSSIRLANEAGFGRTDHLGTAFWRVAERRLRHGAVIAEDHAYSYAWLRNASWTVREYLRVQAGLRPGSLVALSLRNSPEYLAAFYGVLLADCVAVPLPPELEAGRWQQICQTCSPAVVISRREDAIHGAWPESSCTLGLSATASPPPADVAVARGSQDLAMVLFTSGSTGAPKGVMLSHRNLLSNAHSILDYLPVREDDRALVVLPFYHAFGNSILQTHMLRGATLVLGGSLAIPGTIVSALQQQRITSFSGVPEVYAMLLRFADLGAQALPDLRYMSVAGGALRPELVEQIAGRIDPARFYVMYGQSEATARLSYLPPELRTAKRGSIGKGIPGVELRVVDPFDMPVGPGQPGLLQARGENVMLGYWRDPEGSARVLRGGWLNTGDQATTDEDGFVYLRGRANQLVKIQGNRVHPAEVEEVLLRYFPQAQVAVLPFEPDEVTRLALFLAPLDGTPVSDREVRQICLRELPRHKIPSHIEVLERLPLNNALKIDRQALALRLASPDCGIQETAPCLS